MNPFEPGNFGSLAGTPPASNTFFSQGVATRGKFAGRTFEYILEHKPRYLQWLIEQPDMQHGLTRQQMALITTAAAQAEDQADEDRRRSRDSYKQDHRFQRETKEFWDDDDASF